MAFRQRVQGLQDLPFPSSWSKQARAAAVRHSRTWVLQAVLRWSCFSVGPEGLDVAAHLCPRPRELCVPRVAETHSPLPLAECDPDLTFGTLWSLVCSLLPVGMVVQLP